MMMPLLMHQRHLLARMTLVALPMQDSNSLCFSREGVSPPLVCTFSEINLVCALIFMDASRQEAVARELRPHVVQVRVH